MYSSIAVQQYVNQVYSGYSDGTNQDNDLMFIPNPLCLVFMWRRKHNIIIYCINTMDSTVKPPTHDQRWNCSALADRCAAVGVVHRSNLHYALHSKFKLFQLWPRLLLTCQRATNEITATTVVMTYNTCTVHHHLTVSEEHISYHVKAA